MTWPKHLTVAKDIVELLSKSTYERFPLALKELITNAYDADATRVDIDFNSEKDQIIISDNGNGMTPEKFDFYLRIAGRSYKEKNSPKFGRAKIGQFGIGFLAVFPFCEKITITSTAENSEYVFTAEITTNAFFSKSKQSVDVQEVPIIGKEEKNESIRIQHYTKIILQKPTNLFHEYLQPQRKKLRRDTIQRWDGMKKLEWELKQCLPLEYPLDTEYDKYLKYPEPIKMDVYLNGTKLTRNILDGDVLDHHEGECKTIGNIKFKYLIINHHTPVNPIEARGIQVRIKNVGIGRVDYFGLGIIGKTYARLQHICGEIQILSGLDDAIVITRDNFSWSPDYEAFKNFFIEKIASVTNKIEEEHYIVKGIEEEILKPKLRGSLIDKKDFAEEQIRLLEKIGYKKTERAFNSEEDKGKPPVQINRKSKETVYLKGHPAFEEMVTIDNKRFKVILTEWDWKDITEPAYRITSEQKIEINKNHPLLKYNKFGKIYKGFYLSLAIGEIKFPGNKQIFKYLSEAISKISSV